MPIQTSHLAQMLRQQMRAGAPAASAAGASAAAEHARTANVASQQIAATLVALMKSQSPQGLTAQQAKSAGVQAATEAAIGEVKAILDELMGIRGRLQSAGAQPQAPPQSAAQAKMAEMAAMRSAGHAAAQRFAEAAAAKQKVDAMSQMGEMESLRLQMAMDRLSKMSSTLSNVMKKLNDTSQNIIQSIR